MTDGEEEAGNRRPAPARAPLDGQAGAPSGTAAAGTDDEVLLAATIVVVERFFRALRAGSGNRWLEIDLTLSQVKVLISLAHSGAATVGEIGAMVGIGNAGASLLVDRLVRLGLAQRGDDPTDRRRTRVSLTDAGTDLVRTLTHGGRERLRHVLGTLQTDDLLALLQGMTAATRAAEEAARPG